jgi:hypothetical protein
MPTPSFTQIIHSSNPREARSRRLYRLGRVTAIDGDLATVAVDKDDAGQDLTIDSVQVAAPWSAQVGDWADIAYLDDTPQSPFIRSILFSDTHDPATYMPRGRHDHLGDEARPFKTLSPSDPNQWMAQYVEGSTAYLISNLPELHIRPATQIRAASILPVSGGGCDLGSSAARWRVAYLAGQLSSSVASGTAPFVIASPTLVSNLNADLTDGQHLGVGNSPKFARLGIAAEPDANIPLTVLRFDATQLQLLTAPGQGASLIAFGPYGRLWGSANAHFTGAAWISYNSSYPSWIHGAEPDSDRFIIYRAPAADNPTFSALMILDSAALRPAAAAGLNLGTASNYWNDVNHKNLIDRGCLFWADMFEGGDLAALAQIRKDPARLTTHGLPALDYASLPSPAYRPAPTATEDIYEEDSMTGERRLKYRAGERIGEDGADLNALISIMLGAIRQLDSEVRALKQRAMAS